MNPCARSTRPAATRWMARALLLFLAGAVAAPSMAADDPQAAARGIEAGEAKRPPAAVPAKEGAQKRHEAPIIGAQADRVLRDMSDYLKAAPQLSFHAEITFDDLLPSGQKLQLSAAYDAAVRRPDRVYSEYVGDAGAKRFWYDGKNVTLYDAALDTYASERARPTIDATLEHLIEDLGFTPPLSDLMTADPYATLREHVLYGFDAGVTQVEGVRCHHLAFVEQNLDWQIWIEDGLQWVPRKLVITYKTLPGAPQFVAVLSGWDLVTKPPDALFVPQLPAGAEPISFLTAANAGKDTPSGGTK